MMLPDSTSTRNFSTVSVVLRQCVEFFPTQVELFKGGPELKNFERKINSLNTQFFSKLSEVEWNLKKYCLSLKMKKTSRGNGDFGKRNVSVTITEGVLQPRLTLPLQSFLQHLTHQPEKVVPNILTSKKRFQISSHLWSHPYDPVLETFDLPGKSRMRVADVANLGLCQTRFFNQFLKTKIGTPD